MKRNDDPGDASFFCALGHSKVGIHNKTHIHRICDLSIHNDSNAPLNAMRGGVLSGWAVSQKPKPPSQAEPDGHRNFA
jgi:hypothetical protein